MPWLLGTWMGQLLLGGLTFAAVFAGFALHFEHRGQAKLIAKQEVIANAKVDKANKAARSVSGLPDSGLRDKYFRD